MNNVDFVLLTRGRVDEQILLKELSPGILSLITIVCHPGERGAHIKNWGSKVKDVVEYSASYVGEARDWCLDNLPGDIAFFFEDNISFHVRVDKPDFGNIRKYGLYEMSRARFTEENMLKHQTQMLLDIIDKLETGEYGMVGNSQRFGNNREPNEFVENRRLYGFWAINKGLYKNLGARFSDVVYREDFYIILKFLLSGTKIGLFYKYAIDKENGVNSAGGCSAYRTPEKTNENALWMEQEFPGIVKAREQKKVTWKGYEGKAMDIIVQWKKAYETGLKIGNNGKS